MRRSRSIPVTLLFLGGILLPSGRPEAGPREKWIAIRDATIWTLSGDRIDGGTVLLKDGKIVGVGKRLEIPSSADLIDAAGGHVIPGLIDIQSELYVEGNDLRETRKIAPDLDITDGLDLFQKGADQVLEEGVTAVCVGPGSHGLIGGLDAVVRVGSGQDREEAVLEREAAVEVSLGIGQPRRTSAEWRLGHYHEIRSTLQGAERYRESWEKYEKEMAEYQKKKAEYDKKKAEAEKKKGGEKGSKEKMPEEPKKPKKPRRDPGQEILVRAMAGKIPVRIATERSDSIRNALRLAKEFGLRWILEGGAEAQALAGDLAKAKVPVILGPIVTSAYLGVDAARSKSETAGILSRWGVKVAIGSGGGGGLSSRYLRYQACLAVRHGMEPEAALRAITIVPAEILGVADRIGTIEEGKDADLVILDGEPMRSLSRITHVIRGERVVRLQSPRRPRREF